MRTDEENDNIQEIQEDNHKKSRHPFLLFLSVLLSPVNGFKNFKSARFTPERVNSSLFYPLLAVASAVTFLQLLYYPERTLSETLENAIGVFISFFITYFLSFPLISLICGNETGNKLSSPFGKQFVSLTLSSIVLYDILYGICPFLEPLLFFAPLYTVYLIMKGFKGVRIPDGKLTGAVITLSLIEIFVPYLIRLLFGLMLGNDTAI